MKSSIVYNKDQVYTFFSLEIQQINQKHALKTQTSLSPASHYLSLAQGVHFQRNNSIRMAHEAGRLWLCGRFNSSGCAEFVAKKVRAHRPHSSFDHTTKTSGFPYHICGHAGSYR